MHFIKESLIAAPAETLFAFHERKDAFTLLQPPWQKTVVVQPPASLAVGTRVVLKTKIGPLRQIIEAEHIAYEPGRMFADRMVRGPFASWVHRHIVTPKGAHASMLTDSVEYELPLGVLGRLFGGAFAKHELERLFAYRHDVTRATCEEMMRAGV
jgi:hypothetical protein